MQRDSSNYLSVSDILATKARVPCKFEVQVMRLGYLDPSSGNEHVEAGTKLELPFWLASNLCSRKRRIVSVEMPGPYRQGHRDILTADATVVDLHKLGPYFYEFGLHLLKFPHAETEVIGQILLETFKQRFRYVMDTSQNLMDSDTTRQIARLDELERGLFRAGNQCLTEHQSWLTCQAEKITTSVMVVNHRKRKRNELEESQ